MGEAEERKKREEEFLPEERSRANEHKLLLHSFCLERFSPPFRARVCPVTHLLLHSPSDQRCAPPLGTPWAGKSESLTGGGDGSSRGRFRMLVSDAPSLPRPLSSLARSQLIYPSQPSSGPRQQALLRASARCRGFQGEFRLRDTLGEYEISRKKEGATAPGSRQK